MTNSLFYGDNLDVMRKYLKDETVDLEPTCLKPCE